MEKQWMERELMELGIPDDLREEIPDQQIVYDWNGGMLYETE